MAQTGNESDVVVRGRRGSAVSDVQPVARLDARVIAGTGATTMTDLLKAIAPMTRSVNGGEPVYLLNGQRIGGQEEINTLPPEAIVSFEILPEQAAIKFGYPPTRKVVNIIIKPRFSQVENRVEAGSTTDGGSPAEDVYAGLTRIAGLRRLSLTGEYRHTGQLLQSQRHILPDPASPFDAIGNIGGIDGGEIDPALSAAVGHPVAIAAVPMDPAQRNAIGAYAASADQPRLFDIGPYRTLIGRNDQFTFKSVLAGPVSKTMSGTISLSAERSADRSLQGLPAVSILVPAGNPFSPFAKDVLLNRYLIESTPLVLHTTSTKLNLGTALRGVVAGWNWDLTGAANDTEVNNRGPDQIDPNEIDRAVAGGANPLAAIDPNLLGHRLRQTSRSINRSGSLKAVLNGALLHLPTGDAILTTNVEAERATAHTRIQGFDAADFTIGRTRIEASAAIDLPIASRDRGILPFFGQLSVNASVNIRKVQNYGALTDTSYGAVWAPSGRLQLIGTIKQTGIAPDLNQRSAPIVQVANVPFFDAVTGQSVLVTTIAGGNPHLAATQRSERALNLQWQPFSKEFLTVSAAYSGTVNRREAYQVTALTPATEAAFPDLFVRDASNRLTSVRLQPVNLYREDQRTLDMFANFNSPLGKPPPKNVEPATAPARPYLFLGAGLSPFLEDHLQLRPGSPVLNILDGDAVDAAVTRRRMGAYGWQGLRYKSMAFYMNEQWSSGIDIRGGSPQSDLHFAPLLNMNVRMYTGLNMLFPHAAWATTMRVQINVENLLNTKQLVRDGTGATPNRYQPDYLDPLGRIVKLVVRKTF